MDKLLCDIVKSIVDKPNEVNVVVSEGDDARIFELSVGEGDLGKVIGKKGKNVTALRTLLTAATVKECGKKALLEIIE
tara:strand:- start:538 stop:771 length:234 start_codon:yes stop_codon:yes gene_type:complete